MIIVLNRGKLIQIFVAILGSLMVLLNAVFIGWSSPLVTILLSEDTPLQSGPMTQEEVSLMTSLIYVGSIFGALAAGLLVNRVGRKWALFIAIIPQMIAHALVIVAQEPILFLISRTIGGTIIGSTTVVFPIFMAEISEKNMRTILGNFAGVSFNIGICLGKSLTDLLGFYAVPVACLILSFIFVGFFVMLPDTPEYLIFRNRLEDAEKSLKFYRGVKIEDVLPESLSLEFEDLKNQTLQQDQKTSISLKDLRKGSTILAIIVTLILTCNYNFTGLRIGLSFTETLLEDSGIPVNVSTVDMIISLLQIFSSLVTIFIIRWMGVRMSFLVSYLVTFIAYIVSGVHYFLHEKGLDMLPFKWSFLISITISIVIPTTIINVLTLNVPSLILPVKIKGSVIGLFGIVNFVVGFFMMQYYLPLIDSYGNSFLMGIFSLWCLLVAIFTYFFIPELKKKTSSEIIFALNRRLPKKFRD